MDFRDTGNFTDFTKQRELLLSGQFNTLFNDLSFNLPHRFLSYAKPDSLNNLFQDLFQKLENAKTRVDKKDAWVFDKTLGLITQKENYDNFANALHFLVNTCKIPEKHIYFKKEPVEYKAFKSEKIYLSRYAMCLLTNNLLQESKSFKNDLSAQLFLSSVEKSREKEKSDFEQEMRTAFAGYYFAHPDTDYEELSEVTWIWVRGKRLKLAYDSAIHDLEYLFRGAHGSKKFTYHKFEEFKQNFIFDILFKKTGNMTFKKQYETALESFGYKLGSVDKDEIKWHKGHKFAPKYPGGFFAPHIAFLLTWTINQFCQFEQQEFDCKTKDRVAWLENLAKNFFSAVKEGLFTEKYKYNKTEYDFSQSPTFVEQHHSEANRIVNSIKNGSGPKALDKQSGEKLHENPGALEFWKQHHLFNEDEICCMNVRKYAEDKLKKLQKEYKDKPSTELAKQICDQEEIIRNESMALYGINFQAFVDVPETIGLDGKFSSRPMFGPYRVVKDFYIPKLAIINEVQKLEKDPMAGQYKIDFDHPNIYEIKPIFLNPKKLPDFQIISESNIIIPKGIPFAANPENGKRYYSEIGEFESINPLLPNPPLLNKSGKPSPADANFGFCNFLFEMDHLSIDEQIILSKHLISLDVINRIVYSGNKSLHMRCTIKDAPKNKSEYRWLFFYLAEKYHLVTKTYDLKQNEYLYTSKILDFSCSNNGRATRRPEVIRNDTNKKQDLLHQTNAILDINWRIQYKKYAEQQKQREEEMAAYRASLTNRDGPNPNLVEKVKWLLIDWHDGNRHNLLNKGIVPMMWYAGWTEQEIKKALAEEGNRNLNQTIQKYISNMQKVKAYL